ncbi:MAG: GNAT family N-acetyltransferase [Planctomycetes bacterium]|nr:GNAT family N-acetyltransferase [Planctomycetota bacterium]
MIPSTDIAESVVATRERPPDLRRPPSPGRPKKLNWSVVVLDNWADLEPYFPAWEELAAAALEPNVFYEPWMLRPALESYGAGRQLLLVLVVAQLPAGQPPLLGGLFPLERRRGYKGLPVRVLSLWRYIHCYLGTPLIHADYARACLNAFFDWLAQDPRGAPLLECPWIAGEGPWAWALTEFLEERPLAHLVVEGFTRALLRPRENSQAYLEGMLSGERRRQLRRKEERLGQVGRVDYVELQPGEAVEPWIEEFLRLEASGWKGQTDTALACHEADRRFFCTATREAWRRGQLWMQALRVDGRPIAQHCCYLAGSGAFNFKVAYDETHAPASPGVLLELERIRRLHQRPDIGWVDSCNAPGPALLKELWADRRVLQTLLIAPGKAPGPFLLSLVPWLRWLRRKTTSRAPSPEPHGRSR